jgi:hypothetical protein
MIPAEWLRWLVVSICFASSSIFLVRNFYVPSSLAIAQSHGQEAGAKRVWLLALIVVVQVTHHTSLPHHR